MNILKMIFGTKNARELKKLKPIVAEINRIEAEYQKKNFTDEDFPRMTEEFRKRVAGGESLDDILPEAFALVKNACRHLVGTTEEVCGHTLTWDMVPFDCQLIGGIVLHPKGTDDSPEFWKALEVSANSELEIINLDNMTFEEYESTKEVVK